MKLNKIYFLAIFAALGMHVVWGINLANAACEVEDDLFCKDQKFRPYDECYKDARQAFLEHAKNSSKEELRAEYKSANNEIIEKEASWRKNNLMTYHGVVAHYAIRCKAKAILDSPDLFKNIGSNQQIKTESNQQSNSNKSPSQSDSPQPAAQSVNTQTNTGQQATISKKVKKNPNDVPAKCVGFNHDKTKIVNKCNFPINFSYCMLHQDDQSISVANSCNDGFVDETIYPGRAISDESLNTRFFAIACKFPSKPINMRFISYNEPVEGNCSR